MKLENRLASFIKQQKTTYRRKTIAQSIAELIHTMIDYANADRIRAIFPQYKQSAYLTKMLSDFEKTLGDYLVSAKSFKDALDQFCGLDTIPIMTVHKSKGLEYHTILFVGLEDGAFWTGL
ncbi:MAG TPA: 3'-5' exonuclease [Cyclobacteriaceae bacterium]|nr:3'-5' exonuclease [Cyclobacteriaceae bacterium]